jgi:hypothetical protein
MRLGTLRCCRIPQLRHIESHALALFNLFPLSKKLYME